MRLIEIHLILFIYLFIYNSFHKFSNKSEAYIDLNELNMKPSIFGKLFL